jgi:molecular chaperone DnaJ
MSAQPQREWFEKDYYKILGLSSSATEKEITKAYRKLAKENHPDSHPGREEKFKEISAAYAVLSDTDKRASYDEVRRMGPGAGGFGGGFPGGAGGFQNGDISDLLGGLFGNTRGGAPGARRRNPAGPRRGEDQESSLNLSFEEAVSGVDTAVNLVGDAACESCNATGAAPGTTPVVCSKCGGRGVIENNQGFFSMSQPCGACSGNGMRIERPCPTCNGTGSARRARSVKVRIPAGVEDGQRIRVKNRGGIGFNGGPPGDLYVTVRVQQHSLFGRRGADLTLTIPVTISEAVLGATISVPTMLAPVSLKVPAGSKSGRTLRARGHGAETKAGKGDLLVTIEVLIPTELSDDERTAIEALQKAQANHSPRKHLGV